MLAQSPATSERMATHTCENPPCPTPWGCTRHPRPPPPHLQPRTIFPESSALLSLKALHLLLLDSLWVTSQFQDLIFRMLYLTSNT